MTSIIVVLFSVRSPERVFERIGHFAERAGFFIIDFPFTAIEIPPAHKHAIGIKLHFYAVAAAVKDLVVPVAGQLRQARQIDFREAEIVMEGPEQPQRHMQK